MMGLSPVQLMIVLAIALLLFGANRLPETARGLGRGLREFRGAVTGEPLDEVARLDADAATPAAGAATTTNTERVSS
jgi:sec-independent protein translocase protein TatA